MFELMYDARGIGLAANQVDLPLQLFVVNATGDPEGGEELVFVNPVIDQPKGSGVAEEGCLSIPGVHGNVNRPNQIHITAYDLEGNEIDTVVDGLLARVIQHEYDHLQGVLFIDRVSDTAKKQLADELEAFELEFQSQQLSEKVPDEQTIRKRLAEIEARYC
jgi:peptide deformylase